MEQLPGGELSVSEPKPWRNPVRSLTVAHSQSRGDAVYWHVCDITLSPESWQHPPVIQNIGHPIKRSTLIYAKIPTQKN